jgi:hypothetical protein
MRRLFTLTLAILMMGALGVPPVGAEVVITIAVPGGITDGEIDLVVFTGQPTTGEMRVNSCFAPGEYPVGNMVLRDVTAGAHGLYPGIMSDTEWKPGTRLTNIFFAGACSEAGQTYYLYSGVPQKR